jgi:hypothetical protein
MCPSDYCLSFLRLATDNCFDPAIVQVSDPSGYPQPFSFLSHGFPIPHTLHTAGNDEPQAGHYFTFMPGVAPLSGERIYNPDV